MDDRVRPPLVRSVLDPEWESALESGARVEGDVGGLEDALAVARLLRHTVQPERLSDADETALWREIEAEIAPAPVRRPWWSWGWPSYVTPALAVAAGLVLVWVMGQGGQGAVPPKGDESGLSAQLEAQFLSLEATGRATIRTAIDNERADLRQRWIERARRGGL